jgi:hypothetical protein
MPVVLVVSPTAVVSPAVMARLAVLPQVPRHLAVVVPRMAG